MLFPRAPVLNVHASDPQPIAGHLSHGDEWNSKHSFQFCTIEHVALLLFYRRETGIELKSYSVHILWQIIA